MGLINFIRSNKYIKKYNTNSIIIFSEGNIYYTTNKPIIDELIKKIDVLYITIDKDDKLLTYNNDRFHSIYIEFDFWGQLLMATIQGRLLITTTPSLHVLALKKSPNIKHYSYFMHAPGDIHYYQKHSFDYFDSIVLTGKYQIESIEHLETLRKLKVKEKVVLGLPYLDEYIRDYQQCEEQENNYVLISPSWGVNNFLNKINYDIFAKFFSHGYNIIFRPHPMSLTYDKNLIDSILEKYRNGYNGLKLIYDTMPSGISSMKKSSFMVSATSGVILDYMIITGKKVIIINAQNTSIENLELDDMEKIAWEDIIVQKNCIMINNEQQLDNIFVDKLKINSIEMYNAEIANLGYSSKAIADFFIKKFDGIR